MANDRETARPAHMPMQHSATMREPRCARSGDGSRRARGVVAPRGSTGAHARTSLVGVGLLGELPRRASLQQLRVANGPVGYAVSELERGTKELIDGKVLKLHRRTAASQCPRARVDTQPPARVRARTISNQSISSTHCGVSVSVGIGCGVWHGGRANWRESEHRAG